MLQTQGGGTPRVEHTHRGVRRRGQGAGLVNEVLQSRLQIERTRQVESSSEKREIHAFVAHCSSCSRAH